MADDTPLARPEVKSARPIDAADVHAQLERLLAHPLFANSKRYPVLLARVVEQSLLGNLAELKERTLGIEVFGREPDYDANANPIVRITAGEIRKRLAQYYYDPAHAHELLIELPTGSYLATFHWPEVHESIEHHEEVHLPTIEAPPRLSFKKSLMVLIFASLIFCAAGLGLGLYVRTLKPPPPMQAIDRFWAPLTTANGTVTFCLGEPAQNLDVGSIQSLDTKSTSRTPEPLYFRLHYSGHLALADVITLTRTAAAFENQHKEFRVVPASQASFAQLREGPVVLIGAFDNLWTLRLTQKLRFGFESKDGVAIIVDRKSPNAATWATAWDLPYQKLSRDYAIVARFRDSITGQPVIIAAGISEEGTEAAGEILYNPVYLNALLKNAPKGWEQMNMEVVIETEVIEGHSGPPKVLAAEYW
jgi:hypothetical protein